MFVVTQRKHLKSLENSSHDFPLTPDQEISDAQYHSGICLIPGDNCCQNSANSFRYLVLLAGNGSSEARRQSASPTPHIALHQGRTRLFIETARWSGFQNELQIIEMDSQANTLGDFPPPN
jgi:hypothetical protein